MKPLRCTVNRGRFRTGSDRLWLRPSGGKNPIGFTVTGQTLRVLFDSEIFGLQVYGGVSRYFVELMRNLPAQGVLPRLVAPVTFNHYLRTLETPGFSGMRLPGWARSRSTAFAVRQLLRASDAVSARALGFDVIHHTDYGRRLPSAAPRVVTVHDLIPELFPAEFPDRDGCERKRRACAEASVVVAISDCTRRDLLGFCPELEGRVEVIPHAVDVAWFRTRAHGADDGTLLFVGGRYGYKDFVTFARATARLLEERPDLHVLCVGGGGFAAEELAPYAERGLLSRVAQRSVTDDELPLLYRRARAFVFPSRYEGFGLPILEAFACGCPVVLARASCFPEVADEAGEYFEPGDPDSLLEALRRVVRDVVFRRRLVERGERRLQDFSWRRTAALTAAAYRRAQEVGRE